ncbi:MAG: RodZ domain-containing protein, partial [Rhodospirillales bacterium]
MDNKDQNKDKEQKNGADRSPPVGALLRASRLRIGEDLRQVSDTLCIRYLYLEAIENCRYADLPGNTYAVGFIRSYAEHLGLDGDEVVRRYRAEQVGKKSAVDLAFPTPVQDSGVPKGAIVFVGVLIALVVYGGWYVTTTDESILTDLISPVPDHLKHLVNRSDVPGDAPGGAPQDAATTTPESSRPITGQENAPGDVEKVEQETADTVQQMASAAGQDATRTVEAAGVATTADPVEKKPVKPTTDAAEPASPHATARMESASEATPETPAAVTVQPSPAPAPADNKPAIVSEALPAPVAESSVAAPQQPEPQTPVAVKPEPELVEQATTPSAPDAPAETTSTETVPAPAESAVAAVSEPVGPAPREVTAEDLNSLVLKQATGVAGQSGSTDAAGASGAADPTSAVKPSGIVIQAIGSSWVEIRNPGTGSIVFTGLLNDGKSFVVPDVRGLTLDTGNAGALKITVDGEAVPEIGSIGSVRKNVALDAARLKA